MLQNWGTFANKKRWVYENSFFSAKFAALIDAGASSGNERVYLLSDCFWEQNIWKKQEFIDY